MTLILAPFLGGDERLRIFLMFHCDQKWRARSVKRERLAEGRGNFTRDNMAARYIWGRMNLLAVFIRL
jgi:hypothetical protein